MPLLRLLSVCFALLAFGPISGHAAQPATSPKVEELLQLLGDKDVQDWLRTRKPEVTEAAQSAARADPGAALSSRLQYIRQHLLDLVAAVPQLPSEIGRASVRLRAATEGYRFVTIVLLASSFILLGLAAEWLFRRAVQDFNALAQRPGAATPRQRINGLLLKLILGVGGIASFAVGSFGGFLLFQWPDLLRTIVVTMLIAALALMIARSLLAILFGPLRATVSVDAADQRLLPMSNDVAGHFHTRLALAVGWCAFGSSFVQVLRMVGVQADVIGLVAYALGLGLLTIGLEAVWRCPAAETGETEDHEGLARTTKAWSWFYSVAFTALWLFWVAGAMRLFWLIAVAIALPITLKWSRLAVHHLFRAVSVPEGELPSSGQADEQLATSEAPTYDLAAVAVERILRAGFILASLWWLAWAWGIGFHSLADTDTAITKIARSLFNVLIILLVADLAWQLVKTLISAILRIAAVPVEPGSQKAIRRAKLQTLLPIARNVAMVFFATLAVLMTLSAMGVQIAPLIASAGVVGVAIGFGAQSVVKDVISGMFYLMDDAYRVRRIHRHRQIHGNG